MRRVKNTISGLLDSDGVRHTSHEELTDIVTQIFSDLFTSSQPSDFDDVLAFVLNRVSKDMNESLCRPYSCEEIEAVLKQMHPHKARAQMA